MSKDMDTRDIQLPLSAEGVEIFDELLAVESKFPNVELMEYTKDEYPYNVKSYDDAYANLILVRSRCATKRQVNKQIAKLWGKPYDFVKGLSEESDRIYKELRA